MTDEKRYSVPVDELDAVQVPVAQQVQEENASAHPEASAWSGSVIPAYGDGGGGGGGGSNDADAD